MRFRPDFNFTFVTDETEDGKTIELIVIGFFLIDLAEKENEITVMNIYSNINDSDITEIIEQLAPETYKAIKNEAEQKLEEMTEVYIQNKEDYQEVC